MVKDCMYLLSQNSHGNMIFFFMEAIEGEMFLELALPINFIFSPHHGSHASWNQHRPSLKASYRENKPEFNVAKGTSLTTGENHVTIA